MACDANRQRLVEAALGAALEADLAAHLDECAGCRARLEDRRRLASRIDAGLRETLAAAPAPDFAGRVRQRLRQAETDAPAFPARALRWAVAATLLVAAAAGVIGLRGTFAPGPVTTVAARQRALPSPLATSPPVASDSATGRARPGPAVTQRAPWKSRVVGRPAPAVVTGTDMRALDVFLASLETRVAQRDSRPAPEPDRLAPLEIPPLEVAAVEIPPLRRTDS